MTTKSISPEAKRALAEAEERRKRAEYKKSEELPKENCSRPIEPTRFGDWERKGIAYDF